MPFIIPVTLHPDRGQLKRAAIVGWVRDRFVLITRTVLTTVLAASLVGLECPMNSVNDAITVVRFEGCSLRSEATSASRSKPGRRRHVQLHR